MDAKDIKEVDSAVFRHYIWTSKKTSALFGRAFYPWYSVFLFFLPLTVRHMQGQQSFGMTTGACAPLRPQKLLGPMAQA